MAEGDLVVITRGEPHLIYSDSRTKPFLVTDLDRPAILASCVTESSAQPLSTMICGNFILRGPRAAA